MLSGSGCKCRKRPRAERIPMPRHETILTAPKTVVCMSPHRTQRNQYHQMPTRLRSAPLRRGNKHALSRGPVHMCRRCSWSFRCWNCVSAPPTSPPLALWRRRRAGLHVRRQPCQDNPAPEITQDVLVSLMAVASPAAARVLLPVDPSSAQTSVSVVMAMVIVLMRLTNVMTVPTG